MPQSVFISYRRSDTIADAKLISDRIANLNGEDSVFLDHESIELGENFPSAISERIQEAEIVLVVMGPDWLNAKDEKGNRKIDNPKDWVRKEIETALKLKKTLIPILVRSAKMPKAEDLPKSLGNLCNFQAIEIRPDYFDHDFQMLASRIAPGKRIHSGGWMKPALIVTSLIILAGCILFFFKKEKPAVESCEANYISGKIIHPDPVVPAYLRFFQYRDQKIIREKMLKPFGNGNFQIHDICVNKTDRCFLTLAYSVPGGRRDSTSYELDLHSKEIIQSLASLELVIDEMPELRQDTISADAGAPPSPLPAGEVKPLTPLNRNNKGVVKLNPETLKKMGIGVQQTNKPIQGVPYKIPVQK